MSNDNIIHYSINRNLNYNQIQQSSSLRGDAIVNAAPSLTANSSIRIQKPDKTAVEDYLMQFISLLLMILSLNTIIIEN